VWTRFRIDGRDLEWLVSDGPPRELHVRSVDGRFEVRASIRDGVFVTSDGSVPPSVIDAPVVVGQEFPLGSPASEWPYHVGGLGFELAEGGFIHTELVRSLLGRWAHRRRHRSPK
jgi:hypothetical protein